MTKKTVFLIGDDIRFHSGVAGVLRSIVLGTSHIFNYVIVGAALKHPEENQRIDLSESVNKEANITDSNVIMYPFSGYGSQDLIRFIMKEHKPDVLMMMTDPRYYTHLFAMENEIRKHIPIVYLNIWDAGGGSPMFNKPYYKSCDALLCISKQTKAVTEVVLGEDKKDKVIKYIPHGVNKDHFKPIDKNSQDLLSLKKQLFGKKEYDFVLFFNSRNIRRKQIPDTLMAFRLFIDKLPKEKADKCAFVLHTQVVDENGTDLNAVREAVFGDRSDQVIFDDRVIDIHTLNMLYNIADATVLLSSNEGWGLSATESVMAGTMIIVNVTGGLQDQLRFVDDDGEWINFDERITTNNMGVYRNHGEWGIPVFPSSTSWQGSPMTPYVPDDRINFIDAAEAYRIVYDMDVNERLRRGQLGREWMCSDEAKMETVKMCESVVSAINETVEKFSPRERYNIIKINNLLPKYIKYPIAL